MNKILIETEVEVAEGYFEQRIFLLVNNQPVFCGKIYKKNHVWTGQFIEYVVELDSDFTFDDEPTRRLFPTYGLCSFKNEQDAKKSMIDWIIWMHNDGVKI